jgi:hypothetical protein
LTLVQEVAILRCRIYQVKENSIADLLRVSF